MPKYESKFNTALRKEFPFLKLKSGSENEVSCSICSSVFKVSARGRGDIVVHVNTQKHQKAAQTFHSNRTIDQMLQNSASMDLQAKELTFAYHAGKHRMSGRTADCNSKLMNKCFDPKFICGATKAAKLLQKVPWKDQKITALNNFNFFFYAADIARDRQKRFKILGETQIRYSHHRYFKSKSR